LASSLIPCSCILYHSTFFFFCNDTATTEIYTLSLHDALPISTLTRRRWLTLSSACLASMLCAPTRSCGSSFASSLACLKRSLTSSKRRRPLPKRASVTRLRVRWVVGQTMNRDRPRSELLVKRDARLLEEAREFLSKQAGRPSPEWYARLLDEHGEEIAAVIAWWLWQVQAQLAVLEWWQWTDPLLWMELEASLARRLA